MKSLGTIGATLESPVPAIGAAAQESLRKATGEVIKALIIKDLVTAISIGVLGLLAYSLCLLLATVLPLAAATFLVGGLFLLGLLLLLRRWASQR